jgi:hypothetical protein
MALGGYRYARHDQQLGGASPLWRLMAPTTSQWQLRRREAGWEGSRRRNRDPRNTWPAAAAAVACCAYKAGRFGRAGRLRRSPMSIKGPSRRRGGCARKVAGLIQGGLHGCPRCLVHAAREVVGCLVRLVRGWCGTATFVRMSLAVEKSAEAVVPAGSMVAGKG